jgi:hypothetical protein
MNIIKNKTNRLKFCEQACLPIDYFQYYMIDKTKIRLFMSLMKVVILNTVFQSNGEITIAY